MGKKAKAKGRTPRRTNSRVAANSPRSSMADKVDPPAGAEETSPCGHFDGENDAVKSLLLRIQSSSGANDKCEDCRTETGGKKAPKKGKNTENRRGSSKSQKNSAATTLWVCLDCNHLSCGGDIAVDSTPYGHARRHSKQNKHPLAVSLNNPSLGWCFLCESSIPIELLTLEQEEKKRDPNIVEKIVRENGNISPNLQPNGGYSVRGLTNLGNTCFFNSVTQNLLAMGKLRSYFLNLDRAMGPLTMSMKKLFGETSGSFDSNENPKNRITPSNLFGCVCSKAPQFKGYQQQDSHELLRYLLDGLSTEHANAMKSAKKTKSSDESGTDSEDARSSPTPTDTFVDKFFGGKLSSTVCCTVCGHSSMVFEPFLDLSLPIPWRKPPPRALSLSLPPTKGKFSPRGRGRKFKEKRSPGSVLKSEATEISTSSSTSNLPSCSTNPDPDPETGAVFGPPLEDDSSWMDFIEPEVSTSSVHGPRKEDGEKEEESVKSGLDFQGDAGSEEIKKPESSIILLPYEPLGPIDNPKEEIPSPEPEFEGFGDLFDEDEEESAPAGKEETKTCEDFGVSWLGGNSSESNQEEIDGSDAPVSVDRCLAYFTMPELLMEEQAWDCENCLKIFREESNGLDSVGRDSLGSVVNGDEEEEEREEERRRKIKRDATKRILIDKAPSILTVHLKRFSQDVRGRLNKLNGHVSFQETLDLRPYMNPRDVDGSSSYRLLGVVEHMGSMRGGHYVAYLRGEKVHLGKKATAWFYASDAQVKEVSLSEVLQSEAYLLFYERL